MNRERSGKMMEGGEEGEEVEGGEGEGGEEVLSRGRGLRNTRGALEGEGVTRGSRG